MLQIIDSEKESRRLWILYRFKYYSNCSSKNENYQIWTNSNHPEEYLSKDFTDTKMNYIHENPVRAGIVYDAADYVYSSAANHVSRKGISEVEIISRRQ